MYKLGFGNRGKSIQKTQPPRDGSMYSIRFWGTSDGSIKDASALTVGSLSESRRLTRQQEQFLQFSLLNDEKTQSIDSHAFTLASSTHSMVIRLQGMSHDLS